MAPPAMATSPHLRMMMEEGKPPPEIIEAEAKRLTRRFIARADARVSTRIFCSEDAQVAVATVVARVRAPEREIELQWIEPPRSKKLKERWPVDAVDPLRDLAVPPVTSARLDVHLDIIAHHRRELEEPLSFPERDVVVRISMDQIDPSLS